MHPLILFIHFIFAGIWLGCVLTETLFERALLGQGRTQEIILADLHKRVDLIIEIPAFVIVLLTGALMLNDVALNTVLLLKIAFGLLAVVTNIYCVWLVFHRADAAHIGDWNAFSRLDHLQHKFGAIVLVSLILALGLGGYQYAAG